MPGPVHVHEASPYDQQWQEKVELILVPHPGIANPLAIEMDYAMVDGQLSLSIRAALAAYLLRQWQVDCTIDHTLLGQGCQLALANFEVIEKIANPKLLLGYDS
jgi:hypothetical protein